MLSSTKPLEIKNNMVFRLSNRRSPKEVKLLHLEWAVVTQLNGDRTVGEIADVLALSPEETHEIFQKLHKEGLLELVAYQNEEQNLPPEVFKEIQQELTLVLGPIASILLEDTINRMGKTHETFEKKYLPVLIDLLSNQINDFSKQIKFQKSIFEKLKPFLL